MKKPQSFSKRCAVVGAFCGLLVGCMNDAQFIGPPEGGEVFALAIDENTPPFIETEEQVFFQVERRILLPIVPPTDEEFAALGTNAPAPFDREPWLVGKDFGIEVNLVLKNLDNTQHELFVLANGISEFHEYVPPVVVEDEEVNIGLSTWDRSVVVPALGTVSLSIREDEIDEVAVDLSTVANGAPNPDMVVYFVNHSAHDPRVEPYLPEVVAGLVGLRLGLLVEGVAPNMVLEASIRVRDFAGRLADPQDPTSWWDLPDPTIVPEMMAPTQ